MSVREGRRGLMGAGLLIVGLPRLTRLSRTLVPFLAATLLVALVPTPAQAGWPIGVIGREVTASLDGQRVVALPISATHVGIHWRSPSERHVMLAFSGDGIAFGPDREVEHDHSGRDTPGHTFGALIRAEGARFVRLSSDRPIAAVSVVAIDARHSSRREAVRPFAATAATAAAEQPAVISRAGWGADESLRFESDGTEKWPRTFRPIQKMTVHHTVTENDDPDPEATMRAIYYFHAVSRGWGDIGYNFLIDESGRIYEGRYSREYAAGESPTGEDLNGQGVTGGHVAYYNAGNMGVALLGTLNQRDATPAARAALEQLLAWKAERHAIDPLAGGLYTNPDNGLQKNVANISGHLDWAATKCPGGVFYDTLPALRRAVATRIPGSGPETTVPGAPVLSAKTPTTGKGVKLNWAPTYDGGSPIIEYHVLRLTDGRFVRIATVGPSAIGYRDTKARRGRTYTYVIRAVNVLGPGALSNEASAVAR